MSETIDIFPRSFARRRNKILSNLRQLKDDMDHWNEAHTTERPIIIDFDLSKDIERLVEANKTETKKK